MTTIHPLGLAFAIATQGSVDLIDVRPREEFDRAHVRGARSIPLPKLRAAKILRERGSANAKPLFLICNGRTRAGLAAGMLRGAGVLEPVVVDGGIELWQSQGLPLQRKWHFRALNKVTAFTRQTRVVWRGATGALEQVFTGRQTENAYWWCRQEFAPDA